MQISFQLYSSRTAPNQEHFLTQLSEMGYTQVEGYAGVYDNPAHFKRAMQACGLTMPSGHFALHDLRHNLTDTLKLADQLGISHVIAPYLSPEERPTDASGWRALSEELADIASHVTAQGKTFSWHNHDFEFAPLPDKRLPIDILLEHAPTLGWEADLGWIARAGLNPALWVEKYSDRIVAVHIKDTAASDAEDGWTNVGEGLMAWPELIRQIRTHLPNALLIAEHDNPSDPARFAAVSITNIREM